MIKNRYHLHIIVGAILAVLTYLILNLNSLGFLGQVSIVSFTVGVLALVREAYFKVRGAPFDIKDIYFSILGGAIGATLMFFIC